MIDTNIVNAFGAGSGVDTKSLANQLVELERAPKQQVIDDRREKFETQLSDYGVLRSAMSTLQSSLSLLGSEDTFNAKSVSFPDSDVVIPTAIESEALTGDYSLEVTNIARAQSLASAAFSDPTDAVGKGTLTFQFGDWDDVVLPATPSSFTVNGDRPSQIITIDDSNNSLEGLRDAINEADFGVQASIVFDGTGYVLLLSAPSGENNQMEITVAEDGGSPTNTDGNDLSRFAFNASNDPTSFQMTQKQIGNDAALVVNGLAVTREFNEIDDVVTGLSFTLTKADPGNPFSISIFEDKTTAETTVRDFVAAYNEFQSIVEPLIGFDSETSEPGSLSRDSLAKTMINKLRGFMSQSVAGVSSGFTALTNVGIRTELDGTLSIDEDTFADSFADNFDLIATLFAPNTESDSDKITVTGFGDSTVPGDYAVVISQAPEQGFLNGGAFADPAVTPVDTTGKDYGFTITVDGTTSGTISLPDATTYNTGDELAAALQSLINGDSALQTAFVDADVSYDDTNDRLVFTSRSYGSSSTVSIDVLGADLGDLGITSASGSAGKDVAGTFDGVAGFGLGNVLLPALDTDPYGLKLQVAEGATGANINFSRGFGGQLNELLTDFLSSSGSIQAREDNIQSDIDRLDDDQERLDRRISAFRARLEAQFIAMDAIVDSLKNTGEFLDGILATLPFTASNDK